MIFLKYPSPFLPETPHVDHAASPMVKMTVWQWGWIRSLNKGEYIPEQCVPGGPPTYKGNRGNYCWEDVRKGVD